MSNQRNADKDRETIAANIDNAGESTGLYKVWSEYLERAVSAEQRVAELERALGKIMHQIAPTQEQLPQHFVFHIALKALNGVRLESEDRGE